MDFYDVDTPFFPTPANIVTFLSFHDGIVKAVQDPERRGRVRVECPGLLTTGKKNWTPWIPIVGLGSSAGSNNKGNGDEGFWSPPVPGQSVLVGFIAGEATALFCMLGQNYLEKEDEENKQLLPKEQKAAGKKEPREGTRVRAWKSEAGHTILFDDRGKKEKGMVLDWTGAGLYWLCPGQKEDDKEKEKDESKPRKGERRGLKMVVNGTAKKPSEIVDGGVAYWLHEDLNGSGWISKAEDGKGLLAAWAATEPGEIKASILCDAETPIVYVTAGEVQLQVDGEKGHVAVTRGIIKELEEAAPVDEAIKGLIEAVKGSFDEFKE